MEEKESIKEKDDSQEDTEEDETKQEVSEESEVTAQEETEKDNSEESGNNNEEKEEDSKDEEDSEKEDDKTDENKVKEECKEHSKKKLHYLLVGIVFIAIIFFYTNNVGISGHVIDNHLEGICDDVEGEVNDLYTKNSVRAGSDETGSIGFVDLCLEELYDGRLDEISLAFYFRNLAEYGAINEEMVRDYDILLEGYCPKDLPQDKDAIDPFMLIATYKCPNGCSEGACIS